MSRARRVAALVLAPVLMTIVCLVVVELLFRLLFTVTDVPWYVGEPVLGYRRASNQSGRYLSGDHVRGAFAFNAQGWNHLGDYAARKDSGVTRIALIGDSQVEALQVRPAEMMSAVAENRMRQSGRRVEWLPFGVSGYGTSQEFDVIRRYALDFQPDLVVLLFVQNDPFDTSPYLAGIEPFVTKYSLDERDRLQLESPRSAWSPNWTYRVAAKSAVGRYFIFQRHLPERLKAMRKSPGGNRRAGEFPLRSAPAGASDSSRERRTWLLIERLLQAARDESTRRGAIFTVAFRGSPGLIDAPLRGAVAMPSPESDPYCLGARLEAMGSQCLEPIVKRLGIPYLDLTESLRQSVERTRESHRYPDDIHYRSPTHRAAGEALAAFADSLVGIRSRTPSPLRPALH